MKYQSIFSGKMSKVLSIEERHSVQFSCVCKKKAGIGTANAIFGHTCIWLHWNNNFSLCPSKSLQVLAITLLCSNPPPDDLSRSSS